MKLKVPFVKNLSKWKGNGWCGPLALASMLRYWNIKTSVEDIVAMSGCHVRNSQSEVPKGTTPEGMILTCLQLGISVTHICPTKEKLSYDPFSKRYVTFLKRLNAKRQYTYFEKRCQAFENYTHIYRKPTLSDIREAIDKKRPCVVLFNVGVILGVDKMWSHFVTVVGYDAKNIYVHNVYPKNMAYQKIPIPLFEKAWKADGLNRTLIVGYKE